MLLAIAQELNNDLHKQLQYERSKNKELVDQNKKESVNLLETKE
jgi:hypothetical protein